MPLVGEQSAAHWAYNTGDDDYSVSWSVDMPRSAAFVHLSLGMYYEFEDHGGVDLGISQYKRKRPGHSTETIDLPDFTYAAYDDNMTRVSFFMDVYACYVYAVWDIGFWG